MENSLFSLQTNTFKVEISNSQTATNSYIANLSDGVLRIEVPRSIDFRRSPDFTDKALPNIIEHFLKVEAEKKLHNRLRELSIQTGLKYNKSTVFLPRRVANKHLCRSRKITFGAYYKQSGNIKLNAFLMLMTDEIIDGVLIHELCHSVHQNHSKQFYDLLLSKYPQYKRLREERKTYVELIFAYFR